MKERKCFSCKNTVGDEIHFFLHCPEYRSLRDELLYEAEQIFDGFTNLSDTEKISFILINTQVRKPVFYFYFK